MATNPSALAENAGRITAPDGPYPLGSSKDDSTGTTGDGTPYKKARANDIYGMQQALLRSAGITPSGNADTALVSQYMQAIIELASGRAYTFDDSGVADAYVLDVQANQQPPAGLFDGLSVEFIVGNTNLTAAPTVVLAGLPVKTIKFFGGSVPVGRLVAGQKVKFIYDGTDFQLVPFFSQADYVDAKSGRKNYIINGDFDIWQRGVSFAGSDEYTADRWNVDRQSGTLLVTQESFTIGQTDVPNEPTFFMKILNTVAASGTYSLLAQRIEGVRTLAGKAAVLTFWAKMDSPKSFDVLIRQNFGSGGSGTVVVVTQQIDITTAWQKFEINVSMPSISGKTIGADNQIDVVLREQSFSTFQLDIAQAQFEQGSVATEFEFRPIGEELALCRRYFYNNISGGAFHVRATTLTSNSVCSFEKIYPTEMRSDPAIVSGSITNGTPSAVVADKQRVVINGTANTTNTMTIAGFTADAEL